MMIPTGILTSKTNISASLLLDAYPGAAFAFSTRKLRSAYVGNCLRVKRLSDNTQLDIGFVNNVLDVTTLTTFVGSGNGTIVTWYDQSGNGINITASGSTEPNIINSGTLRLFGTKPSLYFSSSIMFNTSSSTYNQPNTYFLVTEGTTLDNSDYRVMQESYNHINRNSFGKTPSNVYYMAAGGTDVFSTISYNINKCIMSVLFNGASSQMYFNNTTLINNLNPGSSSLIGVTLGAYSPTQYNYQGLIPEYIGYNSNQSANFTGIKNNINSYYTIY